MTSVFREIPKQYWLLLFSTDEVQDNEQQGFSHDKNPSFSLLPSVSKILETLSSDACCQYIGRKHAQVNACGPLDEFCETMPDNHHHILLYLPQCENAEKVLKDSVYQALSSVQNAKVKLLSVSYPENFLKAETSLFPDPSLIVKGEKMQSLLSRKTTESLGCSFSSVWELEKHNSLGERADTEKAWFIFQKLMELESSDAPFKDTIISYIELLQCGIGRIFVTEHSRTVDVDLGISKAQCMCYECLNSPLQIDETPQTENTSSQLFSLFDEDTIIDTSFL